MIAILQAFFRALFGGLVDALNAWRRDKALVEKGKDEEKIDVQKTTIEAQQRELEVTPLTPDDADKRLRDGTF